MRKNIIRFIEGSECHEFNEEIEKQASHFTPTSFQNVSEP